MTGDEVIATAQFYFGGVGGANDETVSDSMWDDFLDMAIRRVLPTLPEEAMGRSSLTGADDVSLTSGNATLADTIMFVLEVSEDGGETLQHVEPETIAHIDYNSYLQPVLPVWAYSYDDRTLYVRPTSVSDVDVVTVDEFDGLSDQTQELTEIPPEFHDVLALLVAAQAYEQEEDTAQAQLFYSRASERMGGSPEPAGLEQFEQQTSVGTPEEG